MTVLSRALLLAAAWVFLSTNVAGGDEANARVIEDSVAGAPSQDRESVPASPTADVETSDDLDMELGPVSAAAQRMLDRVRDSVVKIRGFYGTNRSEAFHGSAFAVSSGGILVTNYHVISRAALAPRDYRLEYHTDDGRIGPVEILAFDLEHDIAVVRADAISPPALRLRPAIPPKGDRAYAVGYPFNLGLVITDGIANGRLESEFSPKLHYVGPMNPGMSGGPALDSKGRVFGINVSFSTRGQLVSFLVPIEFVAPLLERASTPLPAGSARNEVSRQLRTHQSSVLSALPSTFPTQTSGGYELPAELAPFVDCVAGVGQPPSKSVLLQRIDCRADVGVSVEPGLTTGDLQFNHQVLIAEGLSPLQFSKQLQIVATEAKPAMGSAKHVSPYVCKRETINVNHFKSAVTLCARSYRMYEGLYDVTMTVVSLNQLQRGFVSSLVLRGVDYVPAIDVSRRFLGAMRWTR